MHTVVAKHCIGCELCLPPCPVDCIAMVAAGRAWSETDDAHARARFARRQTRLGSAQVQPMRCVPLPPIPAVVDPERSAAKPPWRQRWPGHATVARGTLASRGERKTRACGLAHGSACHARDRDRFRRRSARRRRARSLVGLRAAGRVRDEVSRRAGEAFPRFRRAPRADDADRPRAGLQRQFDAAHATLDAGRSVACRARAARCGALPARARPRVQLVAAAGARRAALPCRARSGARGRRGFSRHRRRAHARHRRAAGGAARLESRGSGDDRADERRAVEALARIALQQHRLDLSRTRRIRAGARVLRESASGMGGAWRRECQSRRALVGCARLALARPLRRGAGDPARAPGRPRRRAATPTATCTRSWASSPSCTATQQQHVHGLPRRMLRCSPPMPSFAADEPARLERLHRLGAAP